MHKDVIDNKYLVQRMAYCHIEVGSDSAEY